MKTIICGAKLLPLLLVLVCAATQAQIYQWVDDQGRTHFDDRASAPGQENVRELKVGPPNLVNRFRAPPPIMVEAPERLANSTPKMSEAPKKPVGVAASQAACAEKKQAYEASRACYDACGIPFKGGRNNAPCGHCTDLPEPRC